MPKPLNGGESHIYDAGITWYHVKKINLDSTIKHIRKLTQNGFSL